LSEIKKGQQVQRGLKVNRAERTVGTQRQLIEVRFEAIHKMS